MTVGLMLTPTLKTQTDAHSDRVKEFLLLRPVWTASLHPLVPGLDVRQDSRERAADDPSDTRPALALLSSLSYGLPVGGGFQIEIPNQNPNANY